ncbi:ATP-binding protein [bacterium]|nr:ATP-binding protein [Rubripirellula sp.]MDB4506262.1 ATP-binding protein [bacterium]MDB4644593.1 ATP-binding protein [Rubripirellula sp.]
MTRLLKGLFASMSLERKCLLFFGSALMVLMLGAFAVVEKLGRELVLNTTRQRAKDFAAIQLLLLHDDAVWSKNQRETVAPGTSSDIENVDPKTVLTDLRKVIIGGSVTGDNFDKENGDRALTSKHEFLSLSDSRQYTKLPNRETPDDPIEAAILEQLRSDSVAFYANSLREQRPDLTEPIEFAENEALSQITPNLEQPLFDEYETDDGNCVYYIPVFFKQSCQLCHMAKGSETTFDPNAPPEARASQIPFRVHKVTMPYESTRESTTFIRAIVVALGMLIVAVTLFVLHTIVRHLVLYPMYHLRDVSDAITHGDTNQRATIETEDEFRELADAFNRMLRHLTETQDQIQEVNTELDTRVDQLAQLNLQLYEANRLKSDFLANMSHELRTPLNSIIGFSEVLQGIDSLNDKQRRYASNIQKSGRLLLEMINDILDLAKVEAGKMDVKSSEFELGRLVSAQCDMIHSLSEDKNISLSVDVPDNLPKAYQDPNKLGQILTNLLSNAIKFTPEGGMIKVTVSDVENGRFKLLISDTGVGIAGEDQSIIFQKFRQSRKVLDGEGLTREFAGTGLGLSIVKELAKLLGGEVDFESELGRGSSFWVTLPWHLPERPPLTVGQNLSAPDNTPAMTT